MAVVTEVEEALASLVRSLGVWPETNVFTGQAASDKQLNCVICAANGDSLEEEPKGTGNFWVSAEVMVKSSAATDTDGQDPQVLHVALVDVVFKGLMVGDLDAQLNAQGRQLTVFPTAFILSSPQRAQDENGAWIDTLPIRLYCCASILPP